MLRQHRFQDELFIDWLILSIQNDKTFSLKIGNMCFIIWNSVYYIIQMNPESPPNLGTIRQPQK